MTMTSAWAPITKSEERDDGTIVVYGKATDDSLDSDLQICDPNWLNEAMPEWYRTGANIREQHDSKRAVGVGVGHDIAPDGHYVKAHIVDPVSVLKVKTGVLKGFSIGINQPKISKSDAAPNGVIYAGNIVELSICDRPANPGCQLTLAKSAKPGMQVKSGDFDAQRLLVRCEELVEKTVAPDIKKSEMTVTLADQLSPEQLERLTEKVVEEPVAKAVEADVEKDATATPVGTPGNIGSICGCGCEPCASCAHGDNGGMQGGSGKAADFDRDAAKALVEATVAKVDDGLGDDESSDISGAEQAIAIIALLIQNEAKNLATAPAQGCDIDLLMQAVHALCWFKKREEAEQGGLNPRLVGLSAEPDVKKAKYSAVELRQMLNAGKAFKNSNGEPSYPIADKQDLENAIHAVGRGSGDHDAIRAYIRKRAAALGASSLIPDNWTSSGSNTGSGKSVESAKENTVADVETVDKSEATEATQPVDTATLLVDEESTETETTKAVTAEDTVSDGDALVKALTASLEKSDSPLRKSFEAIVEAAAESTAKSVSDLSERLEKVEQMAAPGGPALRRTDSEQKTARVFDLTQKLTQYKSLADNLKDPDARKGYATMASAVESEINAIQ